MSNNTRKESPLNPVTEGDANRLTGARKTGIVRREAQREDPKFRDRGDTMGGMKLQLYVHGFIEGYHLYWENDEDGAIERLLSEGFDFTTQAELDLGRANEIVPDLDITSVLSRFVKGQKNDGSPLRAYLMKCPEEVWRDREQDRYDQADQRDADMRRKAANPEDGLRKLGAGYETSVDTKFRKSY